MSHTVAHSSEARMPFHHRVFPSSDMGALSFEETCLTSPDDAAISDLWIYYRDIQNPKSNVMQ